MLLRLAKMISGGVGGHGPGLTGCSNILDDLTSPAVGTTKRTSRRKVLPTNLSSLILRLARFPRRTARSLLVVAELATAPPRPVPRLAARRPACPNGCPRCG